MAGLIRLPAACCGKGSRLMHDGADVAVAAVEYSTPRAGMLTVTLACGEMLVLRATEPIDFTHLPPTPAELRDAQRSRPNVRSA